MKKSINKHLSYAPAEFQISYCGYASPSIKQMNNLLNKQIALLCYEEAKSVEELAQALQIRKEYIQESVNSFTSLKMMKCIDGKYLIAFPMLHEKKHTEACRLNYYLLQKLEIPKRINDLLFSLKEKIHSLDFYGNEFELSYLNWFLYTVLDNCFLSEMRTYFSDKTDEIILNKDVWQSQNYDFSLCATYNYADEKKEESKLKKRIDKTSTCYNRYGDIQFNNVFDAAPFPSAFDEKTSSFYSIGGRNQYLTKETINFYLELVKGHKRDFSEVEKKYLESFEINGVMKKMENGFKPMIPVFTQEVFSELQKMINRAIIPIVKEVAQSSEAEIENLLLPQMHNVKERVDQFYTFWLCYFLAPVQELYWYGLNVEGLEIPDDYTRSVAGMYIIV